MLPLLFITTQLWIPLTEAIIAFVPGVHAGDWVKYDLTTEYGTNDPNPPIPSPPQGTFDIEYYKVVVQSVTETIIKFDTIVSFKNDTTISNPMSIDISRPSMSPPIFIGANLSAGDPLYSDPFSPVINATLMLSYAGMNRQVNYVQGQSDIGPTGYIAHFSAEMYWDRAGGVLDEYILSMQFEKIPEHYLTNIFAHLVIKETNIWSPLHIPVKLKINPQSLNLRSEGKWITASIELPQGFKAKDTDPSTIRLNDTIQAEIRSRSLGCQHLLVKFDRAQVILYILNHIEVDRGFICKTLTLTGEFKNGRIFKGSVTIMIAMPTLKRWQWFPF